MTDNVRQLGVVPIKTQANAEIVTILEELLARAKTGDIVGFAYAGILVDGSSLTQCSMSDNFQQLVGAMRILEFRMMSESRHAVATNTD